MTAAQGKRELELRVRKSILAGVVALLAAPINAISQGTITVGPNVQVSAKNSDRAHWELRMAADPTNAQHLLACAIIISEEKNSFHTVAYASSNAGKDWTPTLESPGLAEDPDCVFGLDGAAYFSTLPEPDDNSKEAAETQVYRSLDGGVSWQKPIVLPFMDREYLTVDQMSEKYRGRIYVQGNGLDLTLDGVRNAIFTLFRSQDQGVTFQFPIKLIPDHGNYLAENGNGEVFSDGTYVVVFHETAEINNVDRRSSEIPLGAIKLVRSEDGGNTFAKADVISPWYRCPVSLVNGLPSIAADHTDGPFKDRIYAVWTDNRSGHCDIRFSYSTDKGKTWSHSKVINDEPDRSSPDRLADHNMPVVAVNKQGIVGIEWYDRRDNPDDVGWWPRFTASLDGGETFLPSVRISQAPHAHQVGELLPVHIWGMGEETDASTQDATIATHIQLDQGQTKGGDTGGMAADASGIFHPLWVDNRTGVLQVWTATVSVNGKAVRNGDEDLALLADVSCDVVLDYTNTDYNPHTGKLSFQVILTNNSAASIEGPIKLRIIGLEAGSGTVQIVNADNHHTGTGAVWDFSNLLPKGVLKPGDKSGAKRLDFCLTGIRPFRRDTNGYTPFDLVYVQSKVLANEPNEISSKVRPR